VVKHKESALGPVLLKITLKKSSEKDQKERKTGIGKAWRTGEEEWKVIQRETLPINLKKKPRTTAGPRNGKSPKNDEVLRSKVTQGVREQVKPPKHRSSEKQGNQREKSNSKGFAQTVKAPAGSRGRPSLKKFRQAQGNGAGFNKFWWGQEQRKDGTPVQRGGRQW